MEKQTTSESLVIKMMYKSFLIGGFCGPHIVLYHLSLSSILHLLKDAISFIPYTNMVVLEPVLKCSSSRGTLPTDLSMTWKYHSYPLRYDFKHLPH